MKYKFLLFPVFLFFFHIGVFARNNTDTVEVLAITAIESPSFVVNFEYNTQGLVVSEIKVADDNYFNYKFEYEYDEQGNIVSLIKTDINYVSREENEYNTQNQIIKKKVYHDYGSGFKFIEQLLYTYQGEQLETIIQQMVTGNGQNFNNNTKQEFSYNKQNLLTQINKYAWISGSWERIEIFDYEYDDFDYLLNYSNSFFSSDVLYKSWCYRFQYDAAQKLEERSYHFPSDNGWNPMPAKKTTFHFEPLVENENILLPNIYQFDELNFNYFQSNRKLVKNDYWESACGVPLYLVESANYIYNTIMLIHDTIPNDTVPNDTLRIYNYFVNNDILIYPNPTTGVLNLVQERIENGALNSIQGKIENVEVFDVYCRKVYEHNNSYGLTVLRSYGLTTDGVTINISHLPAGIYFVKIHTEKGIVNAKVIKQ